MFRMGPVVLLTLLVLGGLVLAVVISVLVRSRSI